jgi:hypothetical protein
LLRRSSRPDDSVTTAAARRTLTRPDIPTDGIVTLNSDLAHFASSPGLLYARET